jgi:pimeloyl-ACP methyl ester carboxylesterase
MPSEPCEPTRPQPGALRWAAVGGPARGTIGLLHGVTSSAATWWAVGPILAGAGYDALAVDLPGHGQGPRPQTLPRTWAEMADLTVGLAGPLALLVGHSMGAVVALALAQGGARPVQGLVLVEPPGAMTDEEAELFALGVEAEGRAVHQDREAYRQRRLRSSPGRDEAEVERSVAAMEAADTAAIAATLRSGGLRWDVPALMAATDVPVLVIAAPGEGGSPLDGGSLLRGPARQAVRALVPAERFVVVDGGHSLHREHPERIAELIIGFAGTLPRPGAGPGPGAV